MSDRFFAPRARRFTRERQGSIAIEGAAVGGMLAVAALSMIHFKAGSIDLDRMSDALTVSSAYIVHGGSDLANLENIFIANYGASYDAFTTAVICASPPTIDATGQAVDQTPQDYEQTATVALAAQTSPGVWSQCADAQDLRFLEMTASRTRDGAFGEPKTTSATLRLRLAQGEI